MGPQRPVRLVYSPTAPPPFLCSEFFPEFLFPPPPHRLQGRPLRSGAGKIRLFSAQQFFLLPGSFFFSGLNPPFLRSHLIVSTNQQPPPRTHRRPLPVRPVFFLPFPARAAFQPVWLLCIQPGKALSRPLGQFGQNTFFSRHRIGPFFSPLWAFLYSATVQSIPLPFSLKLCNCVPIFDGFPPDPIFLTSFLDVHPAPGRCHTHFHFGPTWLLFHRGSPYSF